MKFLSKYIDAKDKPYILTVIVLGCLNHFLYDISGKLAGVAIFCPVNESTWEHLKLLFFPFLFVSFFQYFKFRFHLIRFFYYRLIAVLCGMLSIVILFYTYTGIIGRHFLVVDLLIYFFSVFLSFSIYHYLYRKELTLPSQTIVFSLWILVSMCFFAFTCFPPNIPLFFPYIQLLLLSINQKFFLFFLITCKLLCILQSSVV